MKHAIASVAPPFLVGAMRNGAEQNTSSLQGGAKLAQDAKQRAVRHMKQRRIGEDSVEMASRQIECEKILPPHLATAVNARHFDKARRPIEADRDVPKFGESLQIASGAATEIEQSEDRKSVV
jgi:hypothetical protein